MAGARFEKLCASSGTSAHLRQYARSKNIKQSFQASLYWNWRSSRISVADSLARRSSVCACLDSCPAVLLLRLFWVAESLQQFFESVQLVLKSTEFRLFQ